jgi:hypothetical protein
MSASEKQRENEANERKEMTIFINIITFLKEFLIQYWRTTRVIFICTFKDQQLYITNFIIKIQKEIILL